jgi:hypothetical protein
MLNKVLFLLQSYLTIGMVILLSMCPAVDKFENDTTSVNVAELPE